MTVDCGLGCIILVDRDRTAAVGPLDRQPVAETHLFGRHAGPIPFPYNGETQPQNALGSITGHPSRNGIQLFLAAFQQPARRQRQQLCKMIQRHISTSEEGRRRFAQITRETLQSHGSIVQHALHDIMQLQSCHVEQPLGIGHPVDQPTGHGSRRFERRMRHHVGDARILVVPDAGQHRQRKLRYVGAEPVGVEAVEVAGRSAAADKRHSVEFILPFGNPA